MLTGGSDGVVILSLISPDRIVSLKSYTFSSPITNSFFSEDLFFSVDPITLVSFFVASQNDFIKIEEHLDLGMPLITSIAYPDKLRQINIDNISHILDNKYSESPIQLYPLYIDEINYIIFPECPEIIKQKIRSLYKRISEQCNQIEDIPISPTSPTPLKTNEKVINYLSSTYTVVKIEENNTVTFKHSDSISYKPINDNIINQIFADLPEGNNTRLLSSESTMRNTTSSLSGKRKINSRNGSSRLKCGFNTNNNLTSATSSLFLSPLTDIENENNDSSSLTSESNIEQQSSILPLIKDKSYEERTRSLIESELQSRRKKKLENNNVKPISSTSSLDKNNRELESSKSLTPFRNTSPILTNSFPTRTSYLCSPYQNPTDKFTYDRKENSKVLFVSEVFMVMEPTKPKLSQVMHKYKIQSLPHHIFFSDRRTIGGRIYYYYFIFIEIPGTGCASAVGVENEEDAIFRQV